MTNDEVMLLQRGRIPAEVLLPPVLERLAIRDANRLPEDPGALILLCEQQSLEYETVARAIYRFEHAEDTDYPTRSLDFDTADRLLCGAALYELWYTDLREYYLAVDLTWHKCECEGCEVSFQPTHAANGVTGQRYCSEQCRYAAKKIRSGESFRRQKNWKGTRDKCRNGHPRTPENTKIRKSGKHECRPCSREANNKSYARRTEALRVAA